MEVNLRRMYDSIDVAVIPKDGDLVAGYVDGQWPTFPKIAVTFPKATPVSIATSAAHDARVLDVERGDATPTQAVPWAVRQRKAGRTPTVYCNTSTWPAVKAAFSTAGVPLPLWWEAHYDGVPVLSAGSIAKQYATGRYDTSVVADYWPGLDPAPHPILEDDVVRMIRTPDGEIDLELGKALIHLDGPGEQFYAAQGIGIVNVRQQDGDAARASA